MTDTVAALVVQGFTLANDDASYLPDAVIELPAGQFADLEAIGLVRQATGDEVAAARAPAAPAFLPDVPDAA